MSRMVSIDLNTPMPSLSGVFQTKGSNPTGTGEQPRKFRMKAVASDTKIYEKYFVKRIVKHVSLVQLILAIVILISQLSTTGLLIGPETSFALSESDRVGVGIWASIVTTLAASVTFWAMNRTNFCRLHTSMLLHFTAFLGYVILNYMMLMGTMPHIKQRIYFLQEKMSEVSPGLETRRVLLVETEGVGIKQPKIQLQAELHRLYAALVLTIIMALSGVLQVLFHFFMAVKTGRAICLGKTYFEGRLLHMQAVGSNWRTKSLRVDSKDSTLDLPKLERSDQLPPPPYESGYFDPATTA